METNSQNTLLQLEAFLFHFGEPVSLQKISKILELSTKETEEAIELLTEKFRDESLSPFCLLRNGDTIQMATRPQFASIFQKLSEEEFHQELSPASLETLSLVAYLGPIPRSLLDYVRGVNSSFILRNLLVRGLVERHVSEKRKNTYEYNVSFTFLKHMGVERVEDLPDYSHFHKTLEEFESQSTQEV